MFNVFAVETDRIKKRRGGFFERDRVFAPVAFRLTRVPIEHQLCIYNKAGIAQVACSTEQVDTGRWRPVLYGRLSVTRCRTFFFGSRL